MEKVVNVSYEHVGFNATELSKMSLEEFKKHEGHNFEGDPKKDEKLTEAYNLIKEATKSAQGPAPTAPSKPAPIADFTAKS